MDALAIAGIVSLAMTAVLTAHAVTGTGGSGQSRRSSIIEAWVNICIGFGINFLANMLVLPLVGAHLTYGRNFWMGCVFTGISVCRSYFIRRYFNRLIHNAAVRIAGERI